MPALTATTAEELELDSVRLPPGELARYLQEHLGQRMAAHLLGLADTRQVGRYARPDGPTPSAATERRLREGYKVVRMLVEAYDAPTARAWLFGTNSRLDDAAPIEAVGAARKPEDFTPVVRAARQFASFA